MGPRQTVSWPFSIFVLVFLVVHQGSLVFLARRQWSNCGSFILVHSQGFLWARVGSKYFGRNVARSTRDEDQGSTDPKMKFRQLVRQTLRIIRVGKKVKMPSSSHLKPCTHLGRAEYFSSLRPCRCGHIPFQDSNFRLCY